MTEQAYTEWKLELQRLQTAQNLAAHVAVRHLLTARPDLAMVRAEEFAELGHQIDVHIATLKDQRGGVSDE